MSDIIKSIYNKKKSVSSLKMFQETDILKAVENGDVKIVKEFIKSGGNIYKEYMQQDFYAPVVTLISKAANFKQIAIFELLLEEYEKDYKIAEQTASNEENKDFLMKYVFIAFDEDEIQEVLKLPRETKKKRNLVFLADRKECVLVPIIDNKSLLYKLSKNGFVNINSRSIIAAAPDNGISRLDLLKRMFVIGLNVNDKATEHNFMEGILKSVECVETIEYCLNQIQDLPDKDLLIISAINRNPEVFEVVLAYLTKKNSVSNEDYMKEFITDPENVNFTIHCCGNENFDLLEHILMKYKINVTDYTEADKIPFYQTFLKTEKSLKYLEEVIKFQKLDDILEAVTLETNLEILKFIWSNLQEDHFKRCEEYIILLIKLAYENNIESNILKFIKLLDTNEIYDRYIRSTALFVAIKFDCEPIVSDLISRGADLLHINAIDETALTTACEFASPDIIRLILQKEPSLIHVAGQDGLYPIAKLVGRENINFDILNGFLEKGAKTDVTCSRKSSILHHAVLSGRTDFVEKLLEIGVDPSLQNIDGHTALYLSTKRENLEIFNLILETGKTDIETRTLRDHTILYRACKSYTPEFFNSLMEKAKPNVLARHNQGQTPLFWCRDVARCEKLLELGTDPTIIDDNNFTFYTFLGSNDYNEKIVEFFLQNPNFDLTIVANTGMSLLHSICAMNINIDPYISHKNVQDLVRQCTNTISNMLTTPFHIAADHHNLTMMKYMFEYAEPNLENRNQEGETPIFGNLRYLCNLELLNYLIEKGADVNAQNNEGNTLVFESIFLEGTEILLKSGAALNIVNKKGQTALHYAAIRGDLVTILLLLKHGADLHLKDESNLRPVDLCTRLHVKEFLEFLEN